MSVGRTALGLGVVLFFGCGQPAATSPALTIPALDGAMCDTGPATVDIVPDLSGPVRGVIPLALSVRDPDDAVELLLFDERVPVVESRAEWKLDTTPLSDGKTTVLATVLDACGSPSLHLLEFTIDNSAPRIQLILDGHDRPLTPWSEALVGVVSVEGAVAARLLADGLELARSDGDSFEFTVSAEHWRGGVFPRDLDLVASAIDAAGNTGSVSAAIPVDRVRWTMDLGRRTEAFTSRPVWLRGELVLVRGSQLLAVDVQNQAVREILLPDPWLAGAAEPSLLPDGSLRMVIVSGTDSRTPRLLELDPTMAWEWDTEVRNPYASPATGARGESVLNEEDGSIAVIGPTGLLEARQYISTQSFCCSATFTRPGLLPRGQVVTTWGGGLIHSVDARWNLMWTLDVTGFTDRADFRLQPAGYMLVASGRWSSVHGDDSSRLTALRANGSVVWQRQFVGESFTSEVLTGPDGLYYVSEFTPGVRVFDDRGNEVWHRDTGQYTTPERPIANTRLTLVGGDGVLVVAEAGSVSLVESGGVLSWTYDWRGVQWEAGYPTGGAGLAPAAADDGTVYVVTEYGRLIALGR